MDLSGPLNFTTIFRDYVNTNNGYSIIRMGNVEIDAILLNRITDKLLNNAGFYYSSEKTKNDEFNNWKQQYTDAITNSNVILHVVSCPSFQITMNFLTINNIFKPILPYLEECSFYLGLLHFLTYKHNKKVAIVNYFKEDIDSQLEHINKINPDFIIKKENIVTIKSYQSITGNRPHSCFSETLYTLEQDCIKHNTIKYFIVGCGCYGLPLSNYLKQKGKNVLYIGGILQCLFGLIGKRWENRNNIKLLINEFWKRPTQIPINNNNVEDGCYW
jgi:hypothetical protein